VHQRPYYREHIPAILREVASRYHPEGFTDNKLERLAAREHLFLRQLPHKIPQGSWIRPAQRADWSAREYRAWIEWGYACRLEIWDLFNRTAREAGGPACLW